MMILNKEEKEQLIIKLAMEGLSTREIARLARASFKTIGPIIRKYNGEDIEYQIYNSFNHIQSLPDI